MTEPNFITAVMALIVMFAVAWGYVPIIRLGLKGWARATFIGVFLLSVSISLSLSYWDVAQAVLGDRWPAVRDVLGGQRISTVRNVGVIIGGIILLHGRLLLIPVEERDGYHWWNAWTHPCERCRFPWRRRNQKE